MDNLDLLVVGSGPAGMSAAITGASEGLRVGMIDGSEGLGGRARESSAIENYPGFPEGVTGAELMQRFVRQAERFNTEIECPVMAAAIHEDGDHKVVITDDGRVITARAVMLSLGLSYRRLGAKGISRFVGNGVYYGLPPMVLQHGRRKTHHVVVGGANSAGQAVLRLAQNGNATVTMLIRRTIRDQMSQYLIDRIQTIPNVEVLEGVQVDEVDGKDHINSVTLSDGRDLGCSSMFVFIGAVPKTQWLMGSVSMDEKRFVQTGELVGRGQYETSMKGVFAAGDVRFGSIKRVATSIGEGAAAVQSAYRYLL